MRIRDLPFTAYDRTYLLPKLPPRLEYLTLTEAFKCCEWISDIILEIVVEYIEFFSDQPEFDCFCSYWLIKRFTKCMVL